MATGKSTKPLLVHKDLAEYVKELKDETGTNIHALVEKNLTPEFIKKYNVWATKNNKRKIEPAGGWS